MIQQQYIMNVIRLLFWSENSGRGGPHLSTRSRNIFWKYYPWIQTHAVECGKYCRLHESGAETILARSAPQPRIEINAPQSIQNTSFLFLTLKTCSSRTPAIAAWPNLRVSIHTIQRNESEFTCTLSPQAL